MIIGVVGLLVLCAFAYGGYRRSLKPNSHSQGLLRSLAPAADAEIVAGIPEGNAAITRGGVPQAATLQPPDEIAGLNTDPCLAGPKKGYLFNPETGRPCSAPIERVVVRRAPPPLQVAPPAVMHEITPQEKAQLAESELERAAMVAPTNIRSTAKSLTSEQHGPLPVTGSGLASAVPYTRSFSSTPTISGESNVSGGQAGAGDGDYDGQNQQNRKQAFLEKASATQTDDYLRSTREAPLSRFEIKAGWEIPAVLEQGLNSDLPGELKALVTVNVYDTATGQYLLIPQGSRLVGKYDSHVTYGQSGVQVVWNRVIFPDASTVDLNGMEGLDSEGNAGLRDKVDRHYKRLFGSAALSSLFTAAFDVSQRQSQSVLTYPSPTQTAGASIARNMSETGAAITRRNLNVQPTIKVPVGYRFTVRVNRDILFEAPYEPIDADPQDIPRSKSTLTFK